MRIAALLALVLALPALAQEEPKDIPMLGFDGHEISAWEAADAGVLAGVMVDHIPPGSPAGAAGLKRDDVVFEYDGRTLHGYLELVLDVAKAGIGADVKVSVKRGKEKVSLSWKAQANSEFVKMIGVQGPQLRVDGWVGGDPVSLAKLRGKPVAVVFWTNMLQGEAKPNATDTENMFTAWHQAYKDKGLTVVPVHVIFADFAAHPQADVLKYLEDKKFPLPVAHATGEPFQLPGGQISAPLALSDYRVQRMPAVVLLDKDGKVVARWEGQDVGDGADAKKKIEEMLGAK